METQLIPEFPPFRGELGFRRIVLIGVSLIAAGLLAGCKDPTEFQFENGQRGTCQFDNDTHPGDLVVPSVEIAGWCHAIHGPVIGFIPQRAETPVRPETKQKSTK